MDSALTRRLAKVVRYRSDHDANRVNIAETATGSTNTTTPECIVQRVSGDMQSPDQHNGDTGIRLIRSESSQVKVHIFMHDVQEDFYHCPNQV